MQTATSWLEQEFIKLESTIGIHGKMYELIEQAKEMEKQQMKEAVLNNVTSHLRFRKIFEEQFEHWFAETYGSKGSDEYTTVNWGGVIQKIPIENTNSEKPNILSSKIEISDREMEEVILKRCSNIQQQIGWYKAIEWYREQLKKKQ